MALPAECGNFKVITIKFKESLKVEHYIYVKEHAVREKFPEKPSDKTLFIVGVPPFVTQEMFADVFSQFGKVKAVYFHSNPDPGAPVVNTSKFFNDHPEVLGYKVAYVVFEKSSSLDKVLSIEPEEKLILMAEDSEVPFGMPKWCKNYNDNLIDPAVVQPEIDAYMAEYDKKVEEEEKKLKAAAEPDEEGWTTVTKKSRKAFFKRKESVHKKVMKKESVKNKKKQLVNFYRFQIRENKMNQLVKLREKFEEDKKKIEQIKKSRKFKPF